jgi:Antibiotic biosynthesis monooxygenase
VHISFFALEPPVLPQAGVRYRALREDVEFRFVSITDAPLDDPVPTRAGAYVVEHEDGVAGGAEGVTLINPFEVGAGDEERFLAGWHGVRRALSAQRGYLGTRLHRSDDADLRFVNVARWSSPLMFSRAIQAVDAALPFPSHPALYLVVTG